MTRVLSAAVLAAMVCGAGAASAAPATTRHLAGVAHDFNRLNGRVKTLERLVGVCRGRHCRSLRQELNSARRKLSALEGRVDEVEVRSRRNERRLDGHDERLGLHGRRIHAVAHKAEENRRELERHSSVLDGVREDIDEHEGRIAANEAAIDYLYANSPYFTLRSGAWSTLDGMLVGLGAGTSIPLNGGAWRAATELMVGGHPGTRGVTLVERLHKSAPLAGGLHGRFLLQGSSDLSEAQSWFGAAGPSLVITSGPLEVVVDGYAGYGRLAHSTSGILGAAGSMALRF